MVELLPAITVDLEDIELDHWVAYIQGIYGCFSSGKTQQDALNGVIESRNSWDMWVAGRLGGPLYRTKSLIHQRPYRPSTTVHVAEIFHSFPAKEDPDYLVNAFFQSDIPPLTKDEIQASLALLEYTRTDLIELIQPLFPDKIYQPVPDQRFGTIAAILKHVAVAEWWYCDRLGLVKDWSSLPDDPLKALEVSRANTRARLPELEGSTLITEKVSERWSARKLVRRALWHERDHTNHIRKLLEIV